MRHYETDSASAAGRIVALCMVVDGNMAPSELRALQRSRLLEHIDIDIDTFHDLVSELCQDMLTTSVKHEHVVLDEETIDALLGEIHAPE
ncbi:MAG: TerB family tellurite resistance protein, partial [Burkholderiaceae bacterium]|nr:TerB family tellurite resistance protein [Burkholderiaceae bacterium]